MYMFVSFLGMLVVLAFIVGLVLVVLYAIINTIINGRTYHSFPRWLRNALEMFVTFCGNMGPFFLIFYILGQLVVSLLRPLVM
ncbi:MAG: hypothetical protein ACRCS8_04605 [Brevinema sp.]